MENYRILLSAEQIQQRVKELGEQITKDYQGKEPVFIGMLKGAVYFFADLTKNVKLPIMIDFARLSSYRNGTTSGKMEVIADITANIEGKDVIIVEDIVDSGKTLSYFIELLKQKNPASIKICTLLDKPSRRQTDVQADYKGFEVENEFVIGYGLDYDGLYRNLPFVGILKRSVYEK